MIALSVFSAVFSVCALYADEPMATAEVSVDLGTVLGPVKPMHAVNNGPSVNKPGGDRRGFPHRCHPYPYGGAADLAAERLREVFAHAGFLCSDRAGPVVWRT